MPEPSANILIADDNRVNRLILSRYINLLGHRSELAEKGRIALDKLRGDSFDLLVLDIEMPELDGFAVLEQIKSDHKLRDIPVIVTSSVEGMKSIVRCIELGAEDYLPKPVNSVLLKARVNASLEKKRLRDEQRQLIRRFATPEVEQDLVESGFTLGGKRVHVSVMFCDIRSFTTLCENQSPEETIELLNTYYMLMFDAIGGQGGVVTLLIGDGLMAVFGAPVPLDDCATSAASASLEMIELIEHFNRERKAADKVTIQVGIGIATGTVVAGYVGTEERAVYTCVGDIVNLAARLEAYTKETTHSTLIDKNTQIELGNTISAVPLGKVEIKGKAAAVDIFGIEPHRYQP